MATYEIKNVAEILPDNETTEKIMKKRADDEEIRRNKLLELEAMQEKKNKQERARAKNEQADKARREAQKQQAENAKAQEEEANKKLEGKMVIMLDAL